MAIGGALALIGASLAVVGRRLVIDPDDYYVLVCLPLFVGFGLMLWFAPQRNRKEKRILVWVLTLFWFLSGWRLTGLVHRNPDKAILIFLPLALLVLSEWRYAHLDASHRMAGTLEGTTKRDILVWLATTVSLVLLWQLFRLIF